MWADIWSVWWPNSSFCWIGDWNDVLAQHTKINWQTFWISSENHNIMHCPVQEGWEARISRHVELTKKQCDNLKLNCDSSSSPELVKVVNDANGQLEWWEWNPSTVVSKENEFTLASEKGNVEDLLAAAGIDDFMSTLNYEGKWSEEWDRASLFIDIRNKK